MPSPAAHLLAFVDSASRADEDDASAQRLRRAMAGESPARFAGRLVMERAAHLVSTTDRTLEDIAVDCGFRRYDVFARAFRRELGTLPSQWRADPTSHLLDAPGDVHFQPPDGLRLPARRRMDHVDLVVEMVGHHVRVVTGLVDAARAVADDELDRPADGSTLHSTLRSALAAAVERMAALTALVHDTPLGVPPDRSLPGLRDHLARVGPDFVDAVALLGATGRFDEAFVDAFTPHPTTRSFGTMVTRAITDADGVLLLARTRLRECGVAWEAPT
ncbi:MAG TPA: helix-turn-helix domain-containing protein [Nocardioides sp.]|nr:helix-turn-helix domain-containing protein [Nocardioides sp.]